MSELLPIVILGTGLFAEDTADWLADVPDWQLVGFVEGLDRTRCATTICGHQVYWIDDIADLAATCWGICAVGTPRRSRFIRQAADHGLRFATVVHPSAQVSLRATVGAGTVISRGSIVSAGTQLGQHIIVNRGSLIGHHDVIGDFVTISPGANIAGRVHIGHYTYIGMGSVILDGLAIGNNVIVGAGAVVTRDVPDNVQVVGVPAQVVKHLDPYADVE